MSSADADVRRIRRELKRRGSPSYARRLQMFFKSPVPAYGWRTARVRKLAQRLRPEISGEGDGQRLFAVAERFFAAPSIEEKSLGVFLLERAVRRCGPREFRRLERWLRHVTNWAACDALSIYLLGPMIAAQPRRVSRVFRWARSRNRWCRRASAASLVPGTRRGLPTRDILRLAGRLLDDQDEMVQKGVGWLLRELGKARPREAMAYLWRVRRRAPRLVLRTACETLPARTRRRILA